MKNPSLCLLFLGFFGATVGCSDDGGAFSPIDARPVPDASLIFDASVPDAPPDAAPDAAPDARPLSGDIAADLAAIPGMVVRQGVSQTVGYRYFALTYDQPVDHKDPGGARFQQRIRLLHRDYDAPAVLITEGYFVNDVARRIELAALTNGNQISVEHRYFVPSRPMPTDWTKLDIWQAATDHHRVVQALRYIYGGRWLSTGASKSGMASIYHRRFYPQDVDGTVAYVAPLSFGPNDPRYVDFVETAGPDGDCRQKLRIFQRMVLSEPRRSAMVARMGPFFEMLGREKALEHTVLELPFGMWQYFDADTCFAIPTASASDDTVFAFLESVGRLHDYDDADVTDYGPYYYQAAAQLGYPKINETHVADLLEFPGTDTPDDYLPDAPAPVFDFAAMVDIDTWVKDEGQRLLFVYGEYDPWTAGAFNLGNGSSDCFKLLVPAGNHGSRISQLPQVAETVALDAIRRWAGLSAKPSAKPTGEVLAPMIRGRPRL